MRRLLTAVLLALPLLVVGVRGADEQAAPEKRMQGQGPGAELMQQMRELRGKIHTAEQSALKNDPNLQAEVEKLEQQKRDLFVKANPELEALYDQETEIRAKGKGMAGQRQKEAKPEGRREKGEGKGRKKE
ncbi:MAG: hypothetical protein JXR77_01720 [Lentisphaeria bacterium]|nr:hypothetical protein [Lentisphaeria bacterium]